MDIKLFVKILTGEILLTICFSQNNSFMDTASLDSASRRSSDAVALSPSRSLSSLPSSVGSEEAAPSRDEKLSTQSFAGRIAQIFRQNSDAVPLSATSSKVMDLPDLPENGNSEVAEEKSEEPSSSVSFEEMMKTLENKDQESEMPSNLPGGVVVDQMHTIAPAELNSLLFSSESNFLKSLADVQGSTELQVGPWKFENGTETIKRMVSCTKAPTKLVKALKAYEEQTYLKADGKNFALLSSASTPDAPYGGTFRTEVLFCITPGPELPSGEPSSRLVISWRMNFVQSTMMKGMIENGARQGIRDSFQQYAALLAEKVNVVDQKDLASDKDQALASLQVEPQSDWKLAIQYFANFTVISTFFMGLYVLVHLWLAMPSTIQGLEFVGLDLPDSIGEVIVSGILVLQGERVLALISRFMQARVQKGSQIHGCP